MGSRMKRTLALGLVAAIQFAACTSAQIMPGNVTPGVSVVAGSSAVNSNPGGSSTPIVPASGGSSAPTPSVPSTATGAAGSSSSPSTPLAGSGAMTSSAAGAPGTAGTPSSA